MRKDSGCIRWEFTLYLHKKGQDAQNFVVAHEGLQTGSISDAPPVNRQSSPVCKQKCKTRFVGDKLSR